MKTKIIASIIVGIILIGFIIFNIVRPKVETYDSGVEDELGFIKENLVSGGPPKDGIPAIDNPKYISAKESKLDDDAKVFGIDYNGFVAAYPQNILFWHEIVNDEVDGEKISITYCPLTESIIGYKGLNLGVSGELYNSNLVMYDRDTEGRIPQILGKFIEGEKEGSELEDFEVIVTTWKQWKEKYPETLVLSENTGFEKPYERSPYPGYDKIYKLWFPVVAESNLLRTKDFVLGIENNGEFVAVQKEGFIEKYPDGLEIEIGGETVKVLQNEELGNLEVDNSKVKAFEVYWFAWYAYHPETKLIK